MTTTTVGLNTTRRQAQIDATLTTRRYQAVALLDLLKTEAVTHGIEEGTWGHIGDLGALIETLTTALITIRGYESEDEAHSILVEEVGNAVQTMRDIAEQA